MSVLLLIPRYPGTQISANLLGRYLVPRNAFSQRKVLLVDHQLHEVND